MTMKSILDRLPPVRTEAQTVRTEAQTVRKVREHLRRVIWERMGYGLHARIVALERAAPPVIDGKAEPLEIQVLDL